MEKIKVNSGDIISECLILVGLAELNSKVKNEVIKNELKKLIIEEMGKINNIVTMIAVGRAEVGGEVVEDGVEGSEFWHSCSVILKLIKAYNNEQDDEKKGKLRAMLLIAVTASLGSIYESVIKNEP
ncbi:MAG: hypothetical protein JHC26_08580 [Thermofilum sp.]|uniref:hypothetical protein n=1 Tax=Thermofilum sp. TaxID=1961369 RepID=UPI00258DC9F8|nr:hypothetical protein [Thermofilum sp.]MCI4409132.1 hypothetical protein [Thermofilum sp.]